MPDDELIRSEPPSTATVEIAPGVFVPETGLRFQYSRGSGPGGQNVNKVNTKAELWLMIARVIGLNDRAKERLAALAGHRLTRAGEIHLSSDTRRSQDANRSEIIERLRELIVQAKHEPKRRRKTKPSRASKQRRLSAKKMRGEIKSNRRTPSE
jgi:ribosome-associated protein